jgi:hydroxyacylglutathione hydrolase
MYFKQFLNEECGCSSYLIASRQSNECAVIDPALDVQPYLEIIHERGLLPRYIVDTHIHADHVSGARLLAGETGAPLCLHAGADVHYPFQPLHDGETLGLGQLVISVLHTPGHRPESLSLLVTNPPRGAEPSMVLTGDCLFVGDVGRPDLGGPEAAREIYQSVRRLLELEDYVEVFPAHFEGSCGRGMCGRPSSTIGFERRFNPMLQLPSEEAFIRELASARMPKPLNMRAIVETNQGLGNFGWAMLRHPLPHVQEITVEQALPRLSRDDCWLLDVREPDEWERVHIPGAHHIPQSELATRLSEIPAGAVPLVVCQSGVRSRRAAQFLVQAGIAPALSLAGGTAGWCRAGRPVVEGDTPSRPAA